MLTYKTHHQYVKHNRQVLRYVDRRQKSGTIHSMHPALSRLTVKRIDEYYHKIKQSDRILNYDECLSRNCHNIVKVHVELLDQIEELMSFFTHQLPASFGHSLFQAAACEHEIFADYLKQPGSELCRLQSKSPFVSDFDYFLHMASLTTDDFTQLLIRSNTCLDMMFCTWNALEQQNLLLGIENILNEYYHHSPKPEIERLHTKQELAEKLYCKEHCTISFISKLLRYKPSRALLESTRKSKAQRIALRSNSVLKAVNHGDSNLILSLMVMFYIMGCRTICGLSPYAEPFATQGLPQQISIHTAYGAYLAVKQLFSLTEQKKQLSESPFTLPNFVTFYHVLKGYFEHKLDLYFCKNCGTLQFYYVDEYERHPVEFECMLCGGELNSCQMLLNLVAKEQQTVIPSDL
ncbi:MAG: hypothetical protein K6F05_08630 [Succinivibrio sp.]|nr:hypothetical protein [Succinivibrio sp.]